MADLRPFVNFVLRENILRLRVVGMCVHRGMDAMVVLLPIQVDDVCRLHANLRIVVVISYITSDR